MKLSVPVSAALALVAAAPSVLSRELRSVVTLHHLGLGAAAAKCPSGQYKYKDTCRDDPEHRPTCDLDGKAAMHICARPENDWWTCDKGDDACDGGPPLGRADCKNCLKHGYSWSPVMGEEGCILSCADGPADASCYSPAYGSTPADCPDVDGGATDAANSGSGSNGDDAETRSAGGMCPERVCEGKVCTTDAVLAMRCSGGLGEPSAWGESTDIASAQEFVEADICNGACGPLQRCDAQWTGYWKCGDAPDEEGEDSAAEEREEEEAEEGECPLTCQGGKTCLADNTITVRCAGGGEVKILTGPTEISSAKEFQEANLCEGACDEGKECKASWKANWKCGDVLGKSAVAE